MAFDYEVLRSAAHVGVQREIIYPILTADYGDGYYGGALIGDANGLYRWTLTWSNKHRDQHLITGRTYNSVAVGSAVPIPQYLHEFFYRRMTGSVTGSANEPFWFRDVDHLNINNRTLSLCRMITPVIKKTQDRRNPYLYNFSFQFQQVRGAVAQAT